jgi:hypothetical protein
MKQPNSTIYFLLLLPSLPMTDPQKQTAGIQISPIPVPKEWWRRLDKLRGMNQTDDVKREIDMILDFLSKPVFHIETPPAFHDS